MERTICITSEKLPEAEKRILTYFNMHGFTLSAKKDNQLQFNYPSSLFDAWKSNPLRWESAITVTLSANEIVAGFNVNTDAQLSTAEEESVLEIFMSNFETFVLTGTCDQTELDEAIALTRKTRLVYYGWMAAGAIVGGLLAFMIIRLSGSRTLFSMLHIPVFAGIFLKWKIKSVKSKFKRQ